MIKLASIRFFLPFKEWVSRLSAVLLQSVGQVTIVLTLFFLFVALAPVDKGTHFSVVWKSNQNRTAHGLSLYAFSEEGSANHLLIEGPSLQLVILARTIDASRGERKTRLADGLSGWWIEIVEDYGTRWPTLRTALTSMAEGSSREEKNSVFSLRLRTSDGFDFKTTLPWRLGGFSAALTKALEGNRQRAMLASSIPSTVREVIHLLTEALAGDIEPSRRVGGESSSLLELCEWSLEVERGRSELKGETWMFAERGDFHRGLNPVEPEQIELVSKFPSLENTDPMRGMKPSDLFPAVDPER
jgi:hypothetical protein